MFRHSSRRLPLNDSINGLSVGFPRREKSIVTPCSYAHLSRLFEINSLLLSVWIRTGSRLSGTRSASIILTTSSPFNDFPAWLARHSRLKLSTTVSARKRRPLNRLGSALHQQPASPPDADTVSLPQKCHRLALLSRPQNFCFSTSCSISLSRLSSATSFFSR